MEHEGIASAFGWSVTSHGYVRFSPPTRMSIPRERSTISIESAGRSGMTEESRHHRQKRIEQSKSRHARITSKLTAPAEEAYEVELAEYHAPCHKEGLPSKWVDWDPDPELRESYESDRLPTAAEARDLCNGCPLVDTQTCERYARTTNQSHGIWGGKRIYQGKWLKDEE